MKKTLYTIGHSLHKVEYFVNLLKKYNIEFIVDVRDIPYSRHAPQYNRELIKIELKRYGLEYAYMGKAFGARIRERSFYTSERYLDYEKVVHTEIFKKGFENIMKGLDEGRKIVLMCAEKDPLVCPRTIMTGRKFYEAGIDVEHILSDGSLMSQQEAEDILVNTYFPSRRQLSLFSDDNMSQEDYIKSAYKEQNRRIAYTLDDLENEEKK